MATHITQINDDENRQIRLRVEGDMFIDDAMNIERIAGFVCSDTQYEVILDVADLDFMDSESAPILKKLENSGLFRIEGIEIFLQNVVNDAERK